MDIDFSNVTNNLVFLGSLGLAFIGWVVALAGAASTSDSQHFTWFVVFYDLFLIVSMFLAVATASERQYRMVMLAFLSIGAVFTCNQINDNIYLSPSSNQTIGAGFIFLAIVQFLWIFLFGTEEDSLVKRSVNSVSIIKQPSAIPMPVNVNQQHAIAVEQVAITPNAEYAHRARALYEYTANPSDSNELSFAKDEELEIVDNKGKWWQARKSDGTVGIVPSNYVQII